MLLPSPSVTLLSNSPAVYPTLPNHHNRTTMSRFITTTATFINISAAIITKSRSPLHFYPTLTYTHLPKSNRTISIRALNSSSDTINDDVSSENKIELKSELDTNGGLISSYDDDKYPSGEFEFENRGVWKDLVVKLRMLIAYPWQRVRKGSVLNLKLRGQISDQVKTRFSSGLSLPQICENLIKAAYDPRISGVYLHIETLNCGWGKIEEIRRHILDFRKSGKFIVGYAPAWGEKEYYLGCACEELYAPPSAYFSLYGLTAQAQFLGGVLEKVGVQPQVQRIGKYKSAGDQLTRKNISEENREVLTTLVDNIYGNWVDKISRAKGKKKEDIENFINEGVYQIQKLKEDGWITDIKYDDEVMSMLKTKLGIAGEKKLPVVDYKKYSKVKKWTVGLSGGRDKIAVIRASGSISRVRGPFSSPSSGIIAEQFIEKIRTVKESKRYKAVIIRIDSPGGDALASDLMWREIRLLAESKPVVASMVDVAASGGYYMAMAAQAIVSENLTLTGSIGVVTGKFNLGKLYERIGFNKEIISKGRFAELTAADQRPFRPDEEKLFAESAQNAYQQFRNKAALSRSMSADKMEEFAQGRVWTGNDAASRGLVDAIGGFSRAVAIAKHKANIPQDKKVTLVELSKSSPSLPEILSGIGSSVIGIDATLKQLMDGLTLGDGVQARMDGIMFQRSEGSSFANPIFNLLKDYLSSL
ncbi:serine protease SPPA, chloroplastic [Rutidosis leptorrhynchoides]|uniref:serine protease SPPA, chloroplastic n=1 Tax=Rutidosis leptorrhynchoides TaxID=125765 RepID=UPI003A9A3524